MQPFIWLVPGQISGGERKKSEKSRLRKGVSILVASPGRLLDHLESTESFRRDKLQFIVLDEVDRLMDLGFSKQITQILTLLPGSDRLQTTLASATVNEGVRDLLRMHFGKHEFIDADTAQRESNPADFDIPKQLQQHSMSVTYKLKLPALCATLREIRRGHGKCVVFVSTTG